MDGRIPCEWIAGDSVERFAMVGSFEYVSDEVLQSLAWIFTALSAVVSIAIGVAKFGLSPAKRAVLIVGIIIFGLAVAAVLIPGSRWGLTGADLAAAESKGGAHVASEVDLVAIQQLIASVGPENVGGLVFEKDGNIRILFNSSPVARRADSQLYAVQFGEAEAAKGGVEKVVAFSGASFDAEIGGRTQTVEILESGGDQVIIATEQGIEMVDTAASATQSGGVRVERLALTQ
jgi:hypothetical protein